MTSPRLKAHAASPPSPAPDPPSAPVINPRAVYGLASAAAVLGLARGTLPREIRLGRLRVAKRAGKYFILGAWLLDWIRGGELTRRTAAAAEGGEG